MNTTIKNIIFLDFLVTLFTIIGFIGYVYNLVDYKLVTILLTVNVLITIYLLYKRQNGFLLVYLLYLFLTNIGIYLTSVFTENPLVEYHGDLSWYYSNFKLVFCIAIFGVLLFVVFSFIFNYLGTNFDKEKISIDKKGNSTFFWAGVIFIILFTLMFMYYIISGKLAIGTYGDYVSSIQDLGFYNYGVFIFSVGIAFVFANVQKENIKYVSILLLPQILMFLITGNRGEVFFPILSALGVLIVRNFKMKWWMNVGILIVLFVLIPFIKIFRNIQSFSLSDFQINWFSSLVEIGYTLRPLGFIALWIDGGEKLAYGESYLAPIQRLIANFIPGLNPINYEFEGYGFRYRMPGMGMNVIGEAFYNGAWVGVALVIGIFAFICWRFSRSTTFLGLSVSTALVSILINNIRNAFSFVPGYIVILILIVIVLVIINEFLMKINNVNKKISGNDGYEKKF